MRVIWISVALSAVFLVALFAFYEPQPNQAQLATGEAAVAAIDNPFVDEKAHDNTANKQVELAVLPVEQVAPANKNAPIDSSIAASPEQALAQSPDTESSPPSVTVAKVGEIVASVSDNPVPIAVEEPKQNEKNEKKPGLAMIALEKEQQKNKIAVIVHETNPQKLTEKEIKALYLDRLTRWQDGSRVMLYDLPLGDKYRDKFSRSILNMTALEADKQESRRRELRIKGNDVEVKAKNVVVSYVEQHPNAVAYVPLNLVRDKASVKIVLTIP